VVASQAVLRIQTRGPRRGIEEAYAETLAAQYGDQSGRQDSGGEFVQMGDDPARVVPGRRRGAGRAGLRPLLEPGGIGEDDGRLHRGGALGLRGR
jgi:hypothetical protein